MPPKRRNAADVRAAEKDAKEKAKLYEIHAILSERLRGTPLHEVLIEWEVRAKPKEVSKSLKRLVSWHPMVPAYTILPAWTNFLTHRSQQPFNEGDWSSEDEEDDEKEDEDQATEYKPDPEDPMDLFPAKQPFADDKHKALLVHPAFDDLTTASLKLKLDHMISEKDDIPPPLEDDLREDEAREKYYNSPTAFTNQITKAYIALKKNHLYRQVLHTSMIAARKMTVIPLHTRTIKSEELPGTMVYILDTEWHNSDGTQVSQLCMASLDGTKVFNRYIRYPYPLHRHWRDLLNTKKVTESPWDNVDPLVALSKLEWLQNLFDFLSYGAVIYCFGYVDGAAIAKAVHELPEEDKDNREAICKVWSEKGIRFFNARVFIGQTIKHYNLEIRVSMGNDEGALGKLHNVYKAFFHSSLLFAKFDRQVGSFFVPAAAVEIVRHAILLVRQYHTMEALADGMKTAPLMETPLLSTSIWELVELPDHPMKCHFWAVESLQPIYHTAHTDTTVLRKILAALLLYMQLFEKLLDTVGPLSAEDVKSRCFPNRQTHAFFYLMTTLSTQHTLFNRQADLGVNQPACLFAYQHPAVQCYSEDFYRLRYKWACSKNKRMRNLLVKKKAYRDPSLLELDPGLFIHVTPEDAIQPKKKDRKVKSASKDMAFYDDLYDPSSKGQNKALVNTMITMIEEKMGATKLTGFPIVDVHEKHRKDRHLPPIGDRPWYYFPARVAKHEPDTIVLHCRHCKNLSDGQNRLKTRGSETITLNVIEFDILTKNQLPTQKLIFCKECKHYEGELIDISHPSRTSHNYLPSSLN